MDLTLDILLLTPDANLRDQLDHQLASDTGQFRLDVCDNQNCALSRLLVANFQMILLDQRWCQTPQDSLPGCQIDWLEELRSLCNGIPVLVLAEHINEGDELDYISRGASEYLALSQLDARAVRRAQARKTLEYNLARLAHYDPLTQIPNRILFRDRLEHAVELAERDNQPFTLMYLDLNGFKEINDQHGHDVGDELIKVCATRLAHTMRRSDSVARIGGDEFTVLLEHTNESLDVAHIAEKIISEIAKPVLFGGKDLRVGCSIGIAGYPDAGDCADSLQRNADMAMYRAKALSHKDGGSAFQFFTEAMNSQVHERLDLEADILRGLEAFEFSLVYQPRIDTASGNMVSLEALLRWNHPKRGLLMPGQFLPVAEDSGLIVPLGYWVLERACRDLAQIRALGHRDMTMAVNLSMRQFSDDCLVEKIAGIFHATGVSGDAIELELAESDLQVNLEKMSLCMRALSHLGCKFILDNFGTSATAFESLQKLPISALKIDRSFTKEMVESQDSARLVNAMVSLGRHLDKQVIGEGVESELQYHLLRSYGCDQLQGFDLHRPMSCHTLLGQLAEPSKPVKQPLIQRLRRSKTASVNS